MVCECPKGAFYLMAALPVDDADTVPDSGCWRSSRTTAIPSCSPPASRFYGTPGKGKNEIRIAYILKQEDLERAMDLLALGIRAYQRR